MIRLVTSTMDTLASEKNLKTLLIAKIKGSHYGYTEAITMLKSEIGATFIIKTNSSSTRSPLIMAKFDYTFSNKILPLGSGRNARFNLNKNAITIQSLGVNHSDKIFINESLSRAQQNPFHEARSAKL